MTKGEDTKQAILETALDMASRLGLESVTIGELAKAARMSKSGLFAHFQSKENLQMAILNHAADVFAADVVLPALKRPAGTPRIRALVDNWIDYASRLTGGCIFVSASNEFSDRPGKVRDLLLRQQEQWLEVLRRVARAAIHVGDFRKDVDCDQFAFDLYSMLMGIHYYHKLLQDPDIQPRQEAALDQLLAIYR